MSNENAYPGIERPGNPVEKSGSRPVSSLPMRSVVTWNTEEEFPSRSEDGIRAMMSEIGPDTLANILKSSNFGGTRVPYHKFGMICCTVGMPLTTAVNPKATLA